jgi:vacuolar-type H+-ATPase subunit E/Vma4
MAHENDEALRASRLAARLAEFPELRARFEEILAVAENARGDANTADEAEERALEQVRRLGQELMQSWAERKHERVVDEYDARRDHRRKGKKKPTG